MTRVEKYRKYREEISNMKVENFSSKTEAINKIDECHTNYDTKVITYDDIMGIHTIYDKEEKVHKRKNHFHVGKYQIVYCVVAFAVIATIFVSLIFVGINIWSK